MGIKAGDKTTVTVVARDVAKGQTVERNDLAPTSVAGVEDAIPVEDIDHGAELVATSR